MIYLLLFWTFFKIGLFTFGGGLAMLPLIQQTVVTDQAWISNTEFMDFIGIAESTPGPFAVNIATFAGMRVAGIAGAASAVFGVILPSFIIILLIAIFCKTLMNSHWSQAALRGAAPVIVGAIGVAFLSLGFKLFFPIDTNTLSQGILLATLLVVYVSFKRLDVCFFVLIGACLGLLLYALGIPIQ